MLEIWRGYYIQDEKKIELTFKDFTCPSEGGVITGLTNDGKKVKGKIESNRRLAFTLEAANGDLLYFEGYLTKNSKLISGNYGFMEDEFENSFKIQREEVKPPAQVEPSTLPTCECNCGKCRKSLSIAINLLDN